MYEVLADYLNVASGAPDVRAVVITGAGTSFCTGADLKARAAALSDESAPNIAVVGDAARRARTRVQRLTNAILDCEVPVIAGVNGVAAGYGMHLALACDLVVAADTARFIEVFVRRGLVPDGGGPWLLPRLIGLQRAKELMFLGDDVSASRAEQLGLVNSVVPAEELENAVRNLAIRLSEGPTVMLTLTKRLLNRSFELDRLSAFDEEALAVEIASSADDAQEGVQSFLERRPSQFQGR
jgi:2-(1,2-epoxy-1,2-dihydrophenyl)acetyl-CoA isomerase